MAGTARQAATVEERRAQDQRMRVRRVKAQLEEVRASEYDEYEVAAGEGGKTRVVTKAQLVAELKSNLAKTRKRLHELEWAAVAAAGGRGESGGNGIYLVR